MTDFPHLARAPIVEALLDIVVELPPERTAAELDPFGEAVRISHPDVFPLRQFQVEAEVGEGDAPSVRGSGGPRGRIYWNADKSRAVQARLDGFTINHVRGYERWEALRDQAAAMWKRYVEVARPVSVKRCSLRYINRIAVPLLVDMERILRTRVEIGPDLPQAIEDYFLRVTMPFESERRCTIVQALEPGVEGTARNLLVDVTAFCVKDIAPDSADLWVEFEALRSIKNRCFFGSLQRSTWEAYQ